jgi:hypothetical protein
MTRAAAVRAGLALWACVFAGAFVAFAVTPATGDGFARGLNRVATFLGWQGAAGLLALCLAAISRGLAPGALRRLALVPAGIAAAGVIAILCLILWGRLYRPPAPEPPGPVTAPVSPLQLRD